jgi:hypothetical protein
MTAPTELEPVVDLRMVSTSIGDVLVDRRVPEGVPVNAVVPGAFESYARILHPARVLGHGDVGWQSWEEVAAGSGAWLSGETPFRRITVPPGTEVPLGPQGARPEDDVPMSGSLPEKETRALVDLIRPFTSTWCWFVVWDGWVGIRLRPDQISVPWLGNSHLVFRGPLDAVLRSDWSGQWQTPHLWFPDDRAWCVGTEIDDHATHVAGSAELIDRLLGSDGLETLLTRPEAIAVRTGEWLMGDSGDA